MFPAVFTLVLAVPSPVLLPSLTSLFLVPHAGLAVRTSHSFGPVIGSELGLWPNKNQSGIIKPFLGQQGKKHFFCWNFHKEEDDMYLELPRKPTLWKTEPINGQKLGPLSAV